MNKLSVFYPVSDSNYINPNVVKYICLLKPVYCLMPLAQGDGWVRLRHLGHGCTFTLFLRLCPMCK